MLILQSCKQKQNPSPMGLEMKAGDKGGLEVRDTADRLQQNRYLFDYVSILSHLTYLMTHTPILVKSLLKHKDGKTFKFIIRNLFFLLTLFTDKKSSEEQLFCLSFDFRGLTQHKRRID